MRLKYSLIYTVDDVHVDDVVLGGVALYPPRLVEVVPLQVLLQLVLVGKPSSTLRALQQLVLDLN